MIKGVIAWRAPACQHASMPAQCSAIYIAVAVHAHAVPPFALDTAASRWHNVNGTLFIYQKKGAYIKGKRETGWCCTFSALFNLLVRVSDIEREGVSHRVALLLRSVEIEHWFKISEGVFLQKGERPKKKRDIQLNRQHIMLCKVSQTCYIAAKQLLFAVHVKIIAMKKK